MTIDKSIGLVKVSPVEGEKDPLVTFVKEPVLRQEQFKVGDTIYRVDKSANDFSESTFRYGYEVLGTYIIRFSDGDIEKTIAYLEILTPADTFERQSLIDAIMDAYDFHTVDPLEFGTSVENINRKGIMERIVTMVG